MKKLEKFMMAAVVGALMLIPFTAPNKDNNVSDVSTVTKDKADISAPDEPSPVDMPGTDEYAYNEFAKGMK